MSTEYITELEEAMRKRIRNAAPVYGRNLRELRDVAEPVLGEAIGPERKLYSGGRRE